MIILLFYFVYQFIFKSYNFREDTVVSASEDGSVLFWDVRSKEYTSKIIPSSNPEIKRPNLGNWVGSVTITKDWMVKYQNL